MGVVIQNRDRIFFCRKGAADARIIAEAYEYVLRRYFQKLTKGVFVDVGANVGKYTIMVTRQLRNNGRVISIEPEASNFEILKANVKLNDLSNVALLNVAFWNRNEKLKLYLGPGFKSTGDHSVKNAISMNFVELSSLKLILR